MVWPLVNTLGTMEANAPVADGVLVESLLAELVKFWLRILKYAVQFGRGSTEAGTQM